MDAKRRPLHMGLFLSRSRYYDPLWICSYSKTCLKRPHKRKTKIGFQDRLSLNAGQKYCRMLQGSILQYFRPSLRYHLSLRSLFCLFLSGCLRQVLLYWQAHKNLVLFKYVVIYKTYICNHLVPLEA